MSDLIPLQRRGHGPRLDRKQQEAIAALITHSSIVAAAKACDLGESTLRRWLQTEAFQQAYTQARQQILTTAISGLFEVSHLAVHTLRDLLTDKQEPAFVRLAAARTALQLGFKGAEWITLEQRVASLETSLEFLEQHQDV